jgi:hypothetical protein
MDSVLERAQEKKVELRLQELEVKLVETLFGNPISAPNIINDIIAEISFINDTKKVERHILLLSSLSLALCVVPTDSHLKLQIQTSLESNTKLNAQIKEFCEKFGQDPKSFFQEIYDTLDMLFSTNSNNTYLQIKNYVKALFSANQRFVNSLKDVALLFCYKDATTPTILKYLNMDDFPLPPSVFFYFIEKLSKETKGDNQTEEMVITPYFLHVLYLAARYLRKNDTDPIRMRLARILQNNFPSVFKNGRNQEFYYDSIATLRLVITGNEM